MAIDKKFEQATKLTETKEKKYLNQLQDNYKTAYKEIKLNLADTLIKYSKDGKFTQEELFKYKRMQTLEKQIFTEINTLNGLTSAQLKTYLTDIDTFNYYQTGYILETESQSKLAFAMLNKKAVKDTIMTPLGDLAIKENATKIKSAIKRSLTQGIIQGEGIKKMAARISSDLDKNLNNAKTIARTETTRVMNKGRQDGFVHAEQMGLEMQKMWVATLDTRTRTSHQHLDGQKVNINDTFSNGLKYPGDQNGSAKEVANCRCTMVTIFPESVLDTRRTREGLIPYTTYDEWAKNRLAS